MTEVISASPWKGPVMAHINTALLTLQVMGDINRANLVRQDPAVVKSAKQFGQDATQALRSGRTLLNEGMAAWRRYGSSGTCAISS